MPALPVWSQPETSAQAALAGVATKARLGIEGDSLRWARPAVKSRSGEPVFDALLARPGVTNVAASISSARVNAKPFLQADFAFAILALLRSS